MGTIVVFSRLRRDVVHQRPPRLPSHLARRGRILFAEEPMRDGPGPVPPERSGPASGATVRRPRMPLHACGCHFKQSALVLPLLSPLLATIREDAPWRRPACGAGLLLVLGMLMWPGLAAAGPPASGGYMARYQPQHQPQYQPHHQATHPGTYSERGSTRGADAGSGRDGGQGKAQSMAFNKALGLASHEESGKAQDSAQAGMLDEVRNTALIGARDRTAPRALSMVQSAAAGAGAVGPDPVAARHHGGLYRISGRGGVGYLFGTIHVGDRSFYPLAPEAERALAGADHVVVELDPGGERAFRKALARHGRYGAGDDIRQHVSADTLKQLRSALHAEGVSLASMLQFKPWLIANLLVSIKLDRQGFRRSEGVEHRLLAQARRRGARVVPLESAELQLGLFNSMDEVEAERYLRDTLAGLTDGSAVERARRTIDAWRSGDAAALDAVLLDATAGRSEIADFTRRKLLGPRNADMAAQIDALVARGGVFFVGVGLLHLLGDDGLPQLLAQRGYLIERVY